MTIKGHRVNVGEPIAVVKHSKLDIAAAVCRTMPRPNHISVFKALDGTGIRVEMAADMGGSYDTSAGFVMETPKKDLPPRWRRPRDA